MPLAKYYSGHGSEVMKKMVSKHGKKKGKQVFYATENKRKGKHKGKVEKALRSAFSR